MMLTTDFDITKVQVSKSTRPGYVKVTYDDTDLALTKPVFDIDQIEMSADEIMYALVGTSYNDEQVISVQNMLMDAMTH